MAVTPRTLERRASKRPTAGRNGQLIGGQSPCNRLPSKRAGRGPASLPPVLAREQSAATRYRLTGGLQNLGSTEEAALWVTGICLRRIGCTLTTFRR